MLPRDRHVLELTDLLRQQPVVSILGARQVGKTTLALQILRRTTVHGERFDLEDPADLARLADPRPAGGFHRSLPPSCFQPSGGQSFSF